MATRFTFETLSFSEQDDWKLDNLSITEDSKLQVINDAFEKGRILLVEHWYYRGSRSPNRLVFTDYDSFEDYLKTNGQSGDSIHIFDITESLSDGKQLTYGKCPNSEGKTPRKGAY